MSDIIHFIKGFLDQIMAKHDFATLKPKIEAAVNEKLKNPSFPPDPEGYSLVDGFLWLPLRNVIGADAGLVVSDKAVPVIAIIGNSTAQLQYFSAEVLLGIRP